MKSNLVSTAYSKCKQISKKSFAGSPNPYDTYIVVPNKIIPTVEPEFLGYRQHFLDSAIDSDVIDTCINFHNDLEIANGEVVGSEVYDALGWRYKRFGYKANESFEAAIFRQESGEAWQVRFKDERKYKAPKGKNPAYLPPVNRGTRRLIAQRYKVEVPQDGSFWDWLEVHPEIPIVITEGAKKALAALSNGFIVISLFGCSAGVSTREKITKIRRERPLLNPDIERFAKGGRQFIIAFDQDTKPTAIKRGKAAIGLLARELLKLGCPTSVATWDSRNGLCKGIDDLIAHAGVEAFEKAIDEAHSSVIWRLLLDLKQRVKRKPDIHIGTDEFSKHVDKLPTQGIVALHGAKGSAKTEAIAGVKTGLSMPFYSLCDTRSLGRNQGKRLGLEFYQDADRACGRLLSNGDVANGVVACIPTLIKLMQEAVKQPEYALLLDEWTKSLTFLLTSKLANQKGERGLLIEALRNLILGASVIYVADADLADWALSYIEGIRDERAFLIQTNRKPMSYDANLVESKEELLGHAQNALEATNKLLYAPTDAKATADALKVYFDELGYSSLLITADTTDDPQVREFLATGGSNIPELEEQGIRVIIASPVIQTGFSITQYADRIAAIFGVYEGKSITPEGVAQALDRVRSSAPRYIYTAQRGRAYSRISRAFKTSKFKRDFERVKSASLRLTGSRLNPATRSQAEGINWDSPELNLLAEIEVNRNLGMLNFGDTVTALLLNEGKHVRRLDPILTRKQHKAIRDALKAARQHKEEQRKTALLLTLTPSAERVEYLRNKETLTPGEKLELERWSIEQFYREELDIDLLNFDRKGRQRKGIRNLEAFIYSDVAAERTAASIERNPDTPQDWDDAATLNQILRDSPLATIIQLILIAYLTGEEVATGEHAKEFGDWARQHATDYKLGFGLTITDKVTDGQILGHALERLGIQTHRETRKVNGRMVNTRYIDMVHFKRVMGVLERRNPGVSPYCVNTYTQTGETVSSPPLQLGEATENVVELHPQTQLTPDQAKSDPPDPGDRLAG